MDSPQPPGPPSAHPGRDGPSVAELFFGFARVAAFAFGGVLPWARYVLVEQRAWLTPDEFTDTLALSQLLPGPNIVNMSIAVGARYRGAAGSLAAVLGILALPVAIVLVLATFYAGFAHLPAVGGALAGMAAAAAGLLIGMAGKLGGPLLRRRFWTAAPFIGATFVAVAILGLPLWPVLLVLAPLSVAAGWRAR